MYKTKRKFQSEDSVESDVAPSYNSSISSIGSVSLDSESSDPRAIWFTEEVYPDTVPSLLHKISEINFQDSRKEKEYTLEGQTYVRQPIKLYISSYGGSVYDGLGLIGAIQTSKTPIHTYSIGKVMSMGLIIAIVGHKRFSYPHTTYMYHSVSSMAWGTVKELEESTTETRRLQNVLDKIVLDNSSYTKKQLTKIQNKKQDHYISADKALELNMVDEII